MIVDLTLREIKDLAEFSGFEIDESKSPKGDDLDAVVCIAKCHPDGLENDNGETERFNLVMYFEDCPEEGVIPLGDPIPNT